MTKMLLILIFILIAVAYSTLLERKILSLIAIRMGPWKLSIWGVAQPLADAIKIGNKQTNVLINFSFFYYYLSSLSMMIFSFMLWVCSPYGPKIMDFKMSLGILMIFLAGHTVSYLFSSWCLSNKYSMMACLRTVSQLISYESVMYMVFFFFLCFSNSFNLMNLNLKFIFIPVLLPFWILSMLAELGRSPYDYPESESELVSGFNLDFGSKFFSILFISEYMNILFFSLLTSFMFMNYTHFYIILFFMVWVRSSIPRYRFDNYLSLCWKYLLPFITIYFSLFLLFLF